MAARLAGDLAGVESPAAAAFSGWAAAHGATRTPALEKAWQAFADARAFWTRD